MNIQRKNKKAMAADEESYLFQGVVNSVVQGGAMPLVFGRFVVGSVLINNELEVYNS